MMPHVKADKLYSTSICPEKLLTPDHMWAPLKNRNLENSFCMQIPQRYATSVLEAYPLQAISTGSSLHLHPLISISIRRVSYLVIILS